MVVMQKQGLAITIYEKQSNSQGPIHFFDEKVYGAKYRKTLFLIKSAMSAI